MKKRLFGLLLMLAVCTLNITPVYAATKNPIKVISQNEARKQLSTSGANILNTINLEKSDLNNGKVAIDIIIDNSKSTEVYYVIDNGSGMSTVKTSLIDVVKEKASSIDNSFENVKQGVVVNDAEGLNFNESEKGRISTTLESVKALGSATNVVDINEAFTKAVNSFESTTLNKVIVAFITDGDSSSLTEYKTLVENAKNNGITVVSYLISLNGTTDEDLKTVTSEQISTIDFAGYIVQNMPEELSAVAVKISFDSYITDNFTITNIYPTVGEASLENNEVVWGVGNIAANSAITLSYILEVKDSVDESLINKLNLRTNRQIVVTQNGTQVIGTYPSDEKIEDEICSPTIMLLEKGSTIDNPNTGIADYIIPSACIMSVALITLVILKNKNEFDRI